MERHSDFIEACRKFIEIDSTPFNGTAEIARYAGELCRKEGLHVEIQNETLNGIDQANIIARPIGFRPEHEFLLQTHLDTSDPGPYGLWTRTGANPFNASVYQDTLFGLGTADTKLDFLCKLEAIKQIRSHQKTSGSNWRLPFVLVGTYGEEQGMPGAVKLIRKKMIHSKIALIGEPTQLGIVHSGKGFANVEIEIPYSEEERAFRQEHDRGDGTTTQSRVFIGKAAHSSFPQMGESAILKLFDYLAKLPEGIAIMEIEGGISSSTVPAHAVLEIDMIGALRDSMSSKILGVISAINEVERHFKNYPDHEFVPPEPTLNIGSIRSFEEHIKIGGCVRLPPTVSDKIYEEWMQILKAACLQIGGIFRVTDYKQPFRSEIEAAEGAVGPIAGDDFGAKGDLVSICQQELRKIGKSPSCGSQAVANEANVFSRFGISCVVIGPGQGVGNSHAPNEHVKLEELYAAVRFYKGVLESICL